MNSTKNILRVIINLALLAGLALGLAVIIRMAVTTGPAEPESIPAGVATPIPSATAEQPYPAPATEQGSTDQAWQVYPPPGSPYPTIAITLYPTKAITAYATATMIEMTPWCFFEPGDRPYPSCTPYPTPTARSGPTPTPIPLVEPAKDAAGTILYLSWEKERGENLGQALNFLQMDAVGVAQSAPVQFPIGMEQGRLPYGLVYPSPDGSRLAVVGEWSVTYLVDTESGKAELLWGGTPIEAFYGWYPDSRKVLIGPSHAVVLIDIYDYEDHVLLAVPTIGEAYGGAASPDGSQVIYATTDPPGIWLVGADGRGARRLFEEQGWFFTWSPDGKRIFFCGAEWAVMDADGSYLHKLGVFAMGVCSMPHWSPDSRTLAMVVAKESLPCFDWSDEIYTLGNILLIDVESGESRFLLDEGGAIDPAWSPDGSRLAFVSSRSGAPEIWAVGVDGTNLRQLTFDGAHKRFPFWRRP